MDNAEVPKPKLSKPELPTEEEINIPAYERRNPDLAEALKKQPTKTVPPVDMDNLDTPLALRGKVFGLREGASMPTKKELEIPTYLRRSEDRSIPDKPPVRAFSEELNEAGVVKKDSGRNIFAGLLKALKTRLPVRV